MIKTNELSSVLALMHVVRLTRAIEISLKGTIEKEKARPEPFLDSYMDLEDMALRVTELRQDVEKAIRELGND
jgi:hypothetical protein